MGSLSRWTSLVLVAGVPVCAAAQTGVDDDRVSLPDGPGSLEGVGENVAVDPNMGLMSYRVPIAAPEGFPGLSPDLALTYSSGSGTGLVGLGWSLATPTIERMASKGVPRYEAADRFAADGGDELVPLGGGVFRARYEKDFVRYTWHRAGSEGHWTAEYPDGRVAWFGADRNGNVVPSARGGGAEGTARYHVVEVADPFGNRLQYRYDDFGGGVPLPVAIEYAHVGGRPKYVVRLDYEQRPDFVSDCGLGYEETLRHRLAGVRVFVAGELTREYALDYQDDAIAGGASRLRSVRTYGAGGAEAGHLLPAQFGFDYSRALGADCEGNAEDCARPYVVDMGVLEGAVNMAGGAATLVDINGDGLPDVLDTAGEGPHRFYLNTLEPDGGHGFSAPIESRVAEGDAFRLSGRNVQEMDLNGDGYADLINTRTGAYLLNGGRGADWAAPGEGLDTGALPNFGSEDTFAQVRFYDWDNDKRIDVLSSTADSTAVFVNEDGRFARREVDPIGAGFATANLQLADMNGDGLNDPVELLEGGGVRYRLALGFGRWTEWRHIAGVDVAPSEMPFVDLEDLNGDGLSDVVVVTPNQIKYALNRNANRFDAFRTIATDDVDGELPERADGVGVLYADMNANGSEDVVWFDPNGRVRYLELFPVRPHLLSRIENHLGMVQTVGYDSSVMQAARADEPWDVNLPYPMLVVARTDTFTTLGGLHEVVEYTYRNGYYDGVEKQFRGFTDVTTRAPGDETQEEALARLTYDAGLEDDYRNGLLLSSTTWSDGREISSTTYEYADCPVAEIPADVQPPVRYVCQTAEQTTWKEGLPEARWVTTRKERAWNGYGNVTREADLGVVGVDGDEEIVETTWVTPVARWLLELPVRRSTYARADGPRADERFYYDGEPFVGLPEGQATRGFLTRRTERTGPDTVADVERNRATAYGQVAERLDPNGDPSVHAHRRAYTYDDAGLLTTGFTVALTDPEGRPYELRRTFRYDDRFQSVSEETEFVLYRDGRPESPINTTRYRYDALGHLVERREMGDEGNRPTLRLAYEFGDPASRLATRRRLSDGNESLAFRCFDGRGREYQERAQVGPARFQVSGFTVHNARGEVVREHQPYVSDAPDCDTAPPAGVLATDHRYDALGRLVETSGPDGVRRTTYEPLAVASFDAEDTPTRIVSDGLGRPVALERRLGAATHRWTLAYDDLGNLSRVTDPHGVAHRQVFDVAGRVVRVESPHHGAVTLAYDAAGNVVARTDGRGVVERREYDGANRLAARYAADPAQATRWRYDAHPACEPTECTNVAGAVAAVTYPVGVAGIATGEDRFGYDARGREVFAARRLGDVDLPVRRTWDAEDRLVGALQPDGTALERRFDGGDRLVAIPGFFDEIRWDDRGALAGVTFANGVRETRTYDDAERLAGLRVDDAAGVPILALTYAYDREANLREIGDSPRPGVRSRALRADLDDWYRDTRVTYGDGEVLDLSFDALDAVTSRTSSLGADSPAHVGDFDNVVTRATRAGAVEYVYDGAGFVTRRGAQALEYDHRGRLVAAGSFRAAYGPDDEPVVTLDDGALTLYGFDDFEVRDGVAYTYVRVDGHRAARRATADFGARVYADRVADGLITAADAYGAEDADQILMAAARRVIAENADATTFLHTDHLDSVVAATDAGGDVRGKRDFFPFGATRWESGWVDPYGYTGQPHFASTGLVHFRHRALDPWSGRWTAPDPAFATLDEEAVEVPGDALTGYAYVANGALTSVDPWGLAGKNKNKAKPDKKNKRFKLIGAHRSKEITLGRQRATRAELKNLSQAQRQKAQTARKSKSAGKKKQPGKWVRGEPSGRKLDRATKKKKKLKRQGIAQAVAGGVMALSLGTAGIYQAIRAGAPTPPVPPAQRPTGTPEARYEDPLETAP